MSIHFHDERLKGSYNSRDADADWVKTMQELTAGEDIKHAADIGCGGGIYTNELLKLGADRAVGIDFSEVSLRDAKERHQHERRLSFQQGTAERTGLARCGQDLVVARALIHHLSDTAAFLKEAARVLCAKGRLIIQDRTVSDCLLPGSHVHIRGWLLDYFPHLAEVEKKRRPNKMDVLEQMKAAGFTGVTVFSIWEKRKQFATRQQLLDDLRQRTGRSILHELTDSELEAFLDFLQTKLSEGAVTEADRWTIWTGQAT
ncbi:class I SAM-dependent methyltransferase [Alkalicoccus luteus]|uniref:class I SAM-dependent methyltransferase n=1 Tax=Alkalicoccus luteus TaxID=1237094 RepID=UPI004033FD1C